MQLNPPKTKRQLRHFLGMVNYYRDLWRKRSHILAPLTNMVSSAAKWVWGKEQQAAFDDMKRVISKETLLAFPDFNKEFHIYTDASYYQLGAVIMQERKPLAFYSRKMNAQQRRYTTGEQELLSIVETLKEFRNILLGQKLIVHTDHKNIVYGNLANDRIARWRLLLEEFGPEYVHVAGKDNTVADVLSQMDAKFGSKDIPADTGAHLCACAVTNIERNEAYAIPATREALAKKLISRKELEEKKFPLNPKLIFREQQKDKWVKQLAKNQTIKTKLRTVEGVKLLTYKQCIVIPTALRGQIVDWYHTYLTHPGATRMERTLRDQVIEKMCNSVQFAIRVRKTRIANCIFKENSLSIIVFAICNLSFRHLYYSVSILPLCDRCGTSSVIALVVGRC